MKHTFTVQLSINTDDIVNFLSFESGGFDYWAMISAEDDAYEAASRRLTKRLKNKHEMICYEDILANILENGGELTITDREDDKEFTLNMAMLLKGYKLYVENGGDMDSDNTDAISADMILQYAIFGEQIYA